MLSRIMSSSSSDPVDEIIQSRHKIAEGILAVNIHSCSLASYLELPRDPFLEVCIDEKKKSTPLCFQKGSEIGTDSAKKIFHFQVEVPHSALSRCNLLSIKLVQGADPLGVLYLHLHDIIRDTPLQGRLDIKSQGAGGEVMAQISVSVAFTYGLFGYSESYHLEDFPSVASYTLFPRIESEDERFNHSGRVINPKPTNPIHLIPSSHLPRDPPSQPPQFPRLSASILSEVEGHRGLLDKTGSRQEKIDLLKKWLRET